MPPTGSPITKEYKNLEGIGGWLLLVAVGIVVAPVHMMIEMYQGVRVFVDGAWEILTYPASDSYLPGFGAFAVVETTANFLLLTASFYVVFLFFCKAQYLSASVRRTARS